MSAHPDGILGLLDAATAAFESDGLSPDAAALKAMQFNLHGLSGALIEIGQTGADLTNAQLSLLVGGLLDTVAWVSARTLAKQAWDEVGDGPIFDDEI